MQPGSSSRPSGPVPVIAADPEVIRVDDEPEEDGAGGGVTQSQGSQRKLTSVVWADFTRVCDDDGVWKAKCKHCGKKLLATRRNVTNHLHTHVKNCIYIKKPGDKSVNKLEVCSH